MTQSGLCSRVDSYRTVHMGRRGLSLRSRLTRSLYQPEVAIDSADGKLEVAKHNSPASAFNCDMDTPSTPTLLTMQSQSPTPALVPSDQLPLQGFSQSMPSYQPECLPHNFAHDLFALSDLESVNDSPYTSVGTYLPPTQPMPSSSYWQVYRADGTCNFTPYIPHRPDYQWQHTPHFEHPQAYGQADHPVRNFVPCSPHLPYQQHTPPYHQYNHSSLSVNHWHPPYTFIGTSSSPTSPSSHHD